MLGNDVEIICGEWETGSNPASVSGEKFNIIIPIERIVRHEGKLALPKGTCEIDIDALLEKPYLKAQSCVSESMRGNPKRILGNVNFFNNQ